MCERACGHPRVFESDAQLTILVVAEAHYLTGVCDGERVGVSGFHGQVTARTHLGRGGDAGAHGALPELSDRIPSPSPQGGIGPDGGGMILAGGEGEPTLRSDNARSGAGSDVACSELSEVVSTPRQQSSIGTDAKGMASARPPLWRSICRNRSVRVLRIRLCFRCQDVHRCHHPRPTRCCRNGWPGYARLLLILRSRYRFRSGPVSSRRSISKGCHQLSTRDAAPHWNSGG